jgi:DNA-binding response OmpR family regulator
MNTTMPIHILLVEDDANLGFVIKDNIEREGMIVHLVTDGESAQQLFKTLPFDICILDVMLPQMDGFTLAEHIRYLDKDVPIIFLTAKSMKEDRIKGFKTGADDYMLKPFNIEELILRIQVFLKRTGKQNNREHYTLGHYTFNINNLELATKNSVKKLTRKEAHLLKLLCDHKNNMLTRELILKQIWGTDDYFAGRSMDVFISKLRKYFTQDPRIEIINHHGIGFKLTIKE